MPQYAILRFSKQKGGFGALESHHERKKEKYASNPDIDTTRSHLNFHVVQPIKSYKKEIDGRIEVAGCKLRKDSVKMIDTLITASPEFFKGMKQADIKAFFEYATEFIIKKVGSSNIFTAVVHMDEKSPHMHLCFTPITADGRLTAKEIIGNQAKLCKWQDTFFEHIVKRYPDFDRGEPARETGRVHIPTRMFKQAANLTKQAEKITAVIESINPLNVGKKRDEIFALIKKFIPNWESFETQVKKYQKSNDRLTKENSALIKQVEEKASVKEQMGFAKLHADYQLLRGTMDLIPPEILHQYQQSPKPVTKTKGR